MVRDVGPDVKVSVGDEDDDAVVFHVDVHVVSSLSSEALSSDGGSLSVCIKHLLARALLKPLFDDEPSLTRASLRALGDD
jgi:hypothetical protein